MQQTWSSRACKDAQARLTRSFYQIIISVKHYSEMSCSLACLNSKSFLVHKVITYQTILFCSTVHCDYIHETNKAKERVVVVRTTIDRLAISIQNRQGLLLAGIIYWMCIRNEGNQGEVGLLDKRLLLSKDDKVRTFGSFCWQMRWMDF